MTDDSRTRRFERLALPHLDAAYNLARWLMRNDHDAEDAVQDAYLRAFNYFGSFQGGNFRAWMLMIVRRCCYDGLARNRPTELVSVEDIDALAAGAEPLSDASRVDDPERALLRRADAALVNELIAELPPPFREVLVLRELHDCAYREIAEIAAIPVGTVMSRLARARKLLQRGMKRRLKKDDGNGL
ncbi:MAG: sigma-70 family RNA polymerase sigma factor [Proteobacteria bacterium]|nr:sigma-70 family RNA polymerase sigma factor [Pseudomonadota bacterium]